jgi:Ca2+/Na+ antiporter
MEDLEAELKRLQKIRDELERENRAEYRKLTLAALLASTAALLTKQASELTFPHAHWNGAMTVGAFTVVLIVLVLNFCVRARKTPRGISGYLNVEKRLLIDEMPNIFQILSLLSFLTLLSKRQLVKIAVTIVVTFLLLVYLTSRRREMIYRTYGSTKKTADDVTVSFNIILGYIIGLTVYGLVSLVSIQIRT